MNITKTPLIIAAVVAGLASVASAVDTSKLPPASTKAGVTFATDIKPIFEASCVRCHGAQRPKAGLRVDTLEGVLKGSKEGKVVEVGDSAKSDLVISVARIDPETAMPPSRGGKRRGPGPADHPAGDKPPGDKPQGDKPPGEKPPGDKPQEQGGRPGGNQSPAKPLTPEQVGLVRAWIDQGAK
jgi:hypothetical protein